MNAVKNRVADFIAIVDSAPEIPEKVQEKSQDSPFSITGNTIKYKVDNSRRTNININISFGEGQGFTNLLVAGFAMWIMYSLFKMATPYAGGVKHFVSNFLY
jgi:hypothetical protein